MLLSKLSPPCVHPNLSKEYDHKLRSELIIKQNNNQTEYLLCQRKWNVQEHDEVNQTSSTKSNLHSLKEHNIQCELEVPFHVSWSNKSGQFNSNLQDTTRNYDWKDVSTLIYSKSQATEP